jgi:hypothetical protein
MVSDKLSAPVRKNILGGVILLMFGTLYSAYAYFLLPLGAINRMGAGMFPLILGLTLIFLSLIVLAFSFKEINNGIKFEVKPVLYVIFSVIIFVLITIPFGLFLSIFVLVQSLLLGDRNMSLYYRLLFAVSVCVFVYLVFKMALGIPLDMWPGIMG